VVTGGGTVAGVPVGVDEPGVVGRGTVVAGVVERGVVGPVDGLPDAGLPVVWPEVDPPDVWPGVDDPGVVATFGVVEPVVNVSGVVEPDEVPGVVVVPVDLEAEVLAAVFAALAT
jgi:hypothetical protein